MKLVFTLALTCFLSPGRGHTFDRPLKIRATRLPVQAGVSKNAGQERDREIESKPGNQILTMNKLIVLLIPLAILAQGCVTWERTWNLGVCQESVTGSYGCTVKVPKSLAGAELIAEISSATDTNSPLNVDLRLRLQNKDSRIIEIQGLPGGNVFLKPGDSFEVQTGPSNGGQRYRDAGFFNTSDGAIKLGIDVVGGKPKEGKIRIMAHSSDAI